MSRVEPNNVDCMNPSGYGVNVDTGERFRLTCRTLACPPCARRKASQTTRAIRLAKANAMVMLTNTGTTWQETHHHMTRFNKLMRDCLGDDQWQCCWHVHLNPSGYEPGQTHVHAAARCINVDPAIVQEIAVRVGMGREVGVHEIKSKGEGYGMRPILDTKGMTHAEATTEIEAYLDANRGQLFHATRQFWRDKNGDPCTVKEARRSVARYRP